jgi:hypothetical protein
VENCKGFINFHDTQLHSATIVVIKRSLSNRLGNYLYFAQLKSGNSRFNREEELGCQSNEKDYSKSRIIRIDYQAHVHSKNIE